MTCPKYLDQDCSYKFILIVVLLQDLTALFLQITAFCGIYGFSMTSRLFKAVF